ncbi:MAG: hypothetical protein A2W95_00605 [Bacteroidetes bacterium GWA2_40_14]|nr:MAG: hypothetical protein A2W95_00605 [Bacteroidetes bacterium GWA2_40_14]
MFRKLHTQLLAILLLFVLINSVVILISQYQAKKRERITNIENRIHDLELLIYNDAQQINNFFTYETYSPSFFTTRQSAYIENHRQLINQIKQTQNYIYHSDEFVQLDTNDLFMNLPLHIDSLNVIFDSITQLVFLRGFKDWGIEGNMRNYAHALEQSEGILLSDLLMLRRHEKDYIIRNEVKYCDKFHKKLQTIVDSVRQSKSLNPVTKNQTVESLLEYGGLFDQVVHLDSIIGIKNNASLKARLDYTVNHLLNDAKLISSNCKISKQKSFRRMQSTAGLSILGFVLISLYLSLKLSKLATRRISKLSDNISYFVESGFSNLEPVRVKNRNDEVGLLIENFELLKHKIHDQIEHLEIKVIERTEEINTQKEQIMEQNKKMMDSVRYAMNIQEAILPPKDVIKKTFPEHFIFFRPKDLVSGDFYWFKNIRNSDFNISILAVADCTGHGVPGAFMSMLGIAFINDIVSKEGTQTTAEILNKLRQKVVDNLAQQMHTKRVNDGMDIALVLIDHNKKTIQFSGAYRDLVLVRGHHMQIIKGDKLPIGKNTYLDEINFTLKEIPFYPQDIIYLFTDGFTDQFGGAKNYKYMSKNFKNLLVSVSNLPMEKQKMALESELNFWKGKLEQTDDILVAGFKMP